MYVKSGVSFQDYVTTLLNAELYIPTTQAAGCYLKPSQKCFCVFTTIHDYSQHPPPCLLAGTRASVITFDWMASLSLLHCFCVVWLNNMCLTYISLSKCKHDRVEIYFCTHSSILLQIFYPPQEIYDSRKHTI